MPRRHSFWNVLNAVLGAIAAIVTAGTGLYLALKTDSPPAASAGVTMPAADAPSAAVETATTYDRTPWVGVELRQNERPVMLRSVANAWDRFEADLAPGPFEIIVTRKADDPDIGILAWHDDSLFDGAGDEELQLRGTGIAGGRFAVPILYLDKEGFNYYDNDRLKRIADDKYAIYVTTIGSGELELPLTRFAGPLHLIIFRAPAAFSMTVPRRDFEMFTLKR